MVPPFFYTMRKINREILRIAVPSIVSNLTVPLLGLVDVAIVGHLGAAAYIGAIAVGGMLFNVIYWLFGFLRMGTSGMTSQAYGRKDLDEMTHILSRSMATAWMVAAVFLVLQTPLLNLAFRLIPATPDVMRLATVYYRICIWGAPATLGLYAFNGWFIGMQNSRFPMAVAITQNIVNIAVSLLLVMGVGMKVEGVALGTLVAQYAGFGMAFVLWFRYYKRIRMRITLHGIWQRKELFRFFRVNRDIFLRTLCLTAVSMFFTSSGSAQGEVILAVNTLLMQLFTLFSYIMDGFAYAAEALSGKNAGAGNRQEMWKTIRHLFVWGTGLSAAFTLLYAVGGDGFLALLTDEASVVEASSDYFYWVLAIPLAGFTAFLWDGVFIGLTATREMFLAMLVAALTFFGIYGLLGDVWHNHALWLAFLAYLFVRGLVQTLVARRLVERTLRLNGADGGLSDGHSGDASDCR